MVIEFATSFLVVVSERNAISSTGYSRLGHLSVIWKCACAHGLVVAFHQFFGLLELHRLLELIHENAFECVLVVLRRSGGDLYLINHLGADLFPEDLSVVFVVGVVHAAEFGGPGHGRLIIGQNSKHHTI